MDTIVRFIGISVLMFATNQYQILMPQVTGAKLNHVSLIAFKQGTRTNPDKDWPVEMEGRPPKPKTFTYQGVTYEYVLVKKEFITISGSTSDAPGPITSNQPPHLSCCCNALRKGGPGFQDKYKNPNLPPAAKGGAIVEIDRGVVSTVTENDRIDTEFKMATGIGAGITITGTKGEGNNVKTIALAAGSSVIFGNTPMCVYSDVCPAADDGDFKFYYTMAQESNSCQGTPSNCEQCKSKQTAACDPGPKCTLAGKVKSASAPPSPGRMRMINIDCSNSQYP
jgi:hypothetical protein